jgi:hypothetical protein
MDVHTDLIQDPDRHEAYMAQMEDEDPVGNASPAPAPAAAAASCSNTMETGGSGANRSQTKVTGRL